MITIRRANTLGQVREGNAHLLCHFAFGPDHDPQHLHDGRLRVVNVVQLAAHEHYVLDQERNIDIVTYVIEGALSTHNVLFPDELIETNGLHLISTGMGCKSIGWQTGSVGAAFLQFWFLPDDEGGDPAQEVRPAFAEFEDGGFRILASGFPEDDPEEIATITDGAPVTLRARSRLLHAIIPEGEGACYQTTSGRTLYLVVVSGNVTINNITLNPGDGVHIYDEHEFIVIATVKAIILLADTAAKE